MALATRSPSSAETAGSPARSRGRRFRCKRLPPCPQGLLALGARGNTSRPQLVRPRFRKLQGIDDRHDNGLHSSCNIGPVRRALAALYDGVKHRVEGHQLAPGPANECAWERLRMEGQRRRLVFVEVNANGIACLGHRAQPPMAAHVAPRTVHSVRARANLACARGFDNDPYPLPGEAGVALVPAMMAPCVWTKAAGIASKPWWQPKARLEDRTQGTGRPESLPARAAAKQSSEHASNRGVLTRKKRPLEGGHAPCVSGLPTPTPTTSRQGQFSTRTMDSATTSGLASVWP